MHPDTQNNVHILHQNYFAVQLVTAGAFLKNLFAESKTRYISAVSLLYVLPFIKATHARSDVLSGKYKRRNWPAISQYSLKVQEIGMFYKRTTIYCK